MARAASSFNLGRNRGGEAAVRKARRPGRDGGPDALPGPPNDDPIYRSVMRLRIAVLPTGRVARNPRAARTRPRRPRRTLVMRGLSPVRRLTLVDDLVVQTVIGADRTGMRRRTSWVRPRRHRRRARRPFHLTAERHTSHETDAYQHCRTERSRKLLVHHFLLSTHRSIAYGKRYKSRAAHAAIGSRLPIDLIPIARGVNQGATAQVFWSIRVYIDDLLRRDIWLGPRVSRWFGGSGPGVPPTRVAGPASLALLDLQRLLERQLPITTSSAWKTHRPSIALLYLVLG
jgi:hypothetical protein